MPDDHTDHQPKQSAMFNQDLPSWALVFVQHHLETAFVTSPNQGCSQLSAGSGMPIGIVLKYARCCLFPYLDLRLKEQNSGFVRGKSKAFSQGKLLGRDRHLSRQRRRNRKCRYSSQYVKSSGHHCSARPNAATPNSRAVPHAAQGLIYL
ncbi:hypothetical protein [Sphingorhabdus buctiana]|uniref:hypothetical protein n=1 Tax=Sphingorhabdus buctiana TaxID=1508805 RepID=UPI0036D2FAC0